MIGISPEMAHGILSSPDPLALSDENITTPSPMKAQRAVFTPRKPLTDTSGNTHVQEYYLNTPPAGKTSRSKSPKHRAQSTSPWRIRLTVQAEQVSEMEGGPSTRFRPTKRLTERTTTVLVPLKGGEETPPAAEKRGRGRPRKSLEAPIKRVGTPKPKKMARRKTVPEALEEQDDDPVFARATPPKKAKGRPRKSLEPVMDKSQFAQADATLRTPEIDEVRRDVGVKKSTRRRSRARRREITPSNNVMASHHESPTSSTKSDGDVNEPTGLNAGPEDHLPLSNHVLQTGGGEMYGTGKLSPKNSSAADQDEEMLRAVASRQIQSPVEEDQDQVDFALADEHREFDTIFESEGFSMVSVSSLASTGYAHSTEKAKTYEPHEQSLVTLACPSVPPVLSDAQCPSESLSNVRACEHTPSVGSPPLVPPAPSRASPEAQRPLEKATDGTPKLARVVRAGVALQGVLSPEEQKLDSPFRPLELRSSVLKTANAATQSAQSSSVSTATSPKDRSDDPFSAFGAGTRRELKAGLRLGEELAKRQRLDLQKHILRSTSTDDVFFTEPDLVYPLSGATDTTGYGLRAPARIEKVQYPVLANPQLPSPKWSVEDADEDRMSWKEDTPVKVEAQNSASGLSLGRDDPLLHHITPPVASNVESVAPEISSIDYTMLAREAEWQREREAVSRQIEMANKSQVIVIGGDEDEDQNMQDETEQGSDIWQAEANQAREPVPESSEIVGRPELVKPRRSKIPSPWRRSSQVICNDECEPTEADLFWQPEIISKAPAKGKPQVQDHSENSDSALLGRHINHVNDSDGHTSMGVSTEPISLEVPAVTPISLNAHQRVKHTIVELPKTPEPTYTEGSTELFEGDITLDTVGDQTINNFEASPRDNTAAIDPLLLQERPQKQPQKPTQIPPSPLKPIAQTQQSWLSLLTAPFWRAFSPLPPPATKEDILSSGPYEPLCQFTPWEQCHSRALAPLYYSSLFYGSYIFPYNRRNVSSIYLGMKVATPGGWSRYITAADCGVVDAFMILLEERGFALGEPGAKWIDELLVVKQCVNIWVGMVMKGEVELDRSKGECSGLRMQGDRLWTREDIDWRKNKTEYFERKKREFDGLPSWKARGLKFTPA